MKRRVSANAFIAECDSARLKMASPRQAPRSGAAISKFINEQKLFTFHFWKNLKSNMMTNICLNGFINSAALRRMMNGRYSSTERGRTRL